MKKIIPILVLILAIGFNSYTQTVDLQRGLVAYYPFNGNANDESGNGNNGTVYGASLTKDRWGNPNAAYEFDGNSNYIIIHSSAKPIGDNSFTLSLWVYITSSSWQTDKHPIFFYSSQNPFYSLGIDMEQYPNIQIISWGCQDI